MVVLAVTWIANQGHESAVIDAFKRLAAGSRTEPGCRLYIVHQHRDDHRRFFVYEQYEDDAALQAHRDTPHFQEIALKTLPSLGKRADAHIMDPLA
ncbi:MAG TPA: putative quinol monooxygenase [Candidatus Koribacter sp.]|jgi:quinol monooxygenase YgiN